jgi:hypothetical protein
MGVQGDAAVPCMGTWDVVPGDRATARLNVRPALERSTQLVVESRDAQRVGILRRLEADARGHHALSVESHRHVLQPEEALDKQGGHDEEHRCEGHLRDDESLAQGRV